MTVELPEQIASELKERDVPNDNIQRFIVRSLEVWLRVGYKSDTPQQTNASGTSSASPFSEDAIPFIDQLLDDNIELFEQLAKH